MKDDIAEIKSVLDQLLVQMALVTTKQNAMTSMLFGVYKETLGTEQASNILNNFVEVLQEMSNEALDRLNDIVYNNNIIIKEKFELFSYIQALKLSNS